MSSYAYGQYSQSPRTGRPLDRTAAKPVNFSNIVFSNLRICPECDHSYYGIHPDTNCPFGIVEKIMES